MLKVYGNSNCYDCINCKMNFDKYHIEYEFIDILASLKNLKEFLYYRDEYKEVFSRLIEIHDIGIPCIIDDKNVFTDWETYLKNKGFIELDYIDMHNACSIDGKGC